MRTARLFLLAAACLWLLPVRWSLWTDEFYSAGLVSKAVADVVQAAASDRHPPGYYLGLWLLGHLTTSDNGLRLASGLALLAALGVTLSAARRHFGDEVAAATVAWFACSAVPFTFAHTLRMYGQSALAGAVLLWGALEATAVEDTRARRGIAALAFGTVLAFYTHYAAALVAIPAFLTAGLAAAHARRWQRFGEGAAAGLFAAVCIAPWLLGPVRTQFAERTPHGAHAWEVLGYLLWNAREAVHPLSWLALAAMVAGLALSVRRPRVGVVLAGFGVAMVAIPWLASTSLPARLPRNFIGFFPVAALLAGIAVRALAARLWAREAELLGAGLAALCTLSVTASALTDRAHPQDIGGGHDYRVEAGILRAMIPPTATLTFIPGYTVNQVSRYEPSLAQQVAPKGTWTLRGGGGGAGECDVVHAFRHRVNIPEADCAAALAVLANEAARTGYGPALLERARRELAAGRLVEAQQTVQAAEAWGVRGPLAAMTRAEAAQQSMEPEAALPAYEQAVAEARSLESAGKAIAGLWGRVAGLRRKQGNDAGAAEAEAAQACAATRAPAWACGGPLAGLTRDASLDAAEE